MAALKEMYAVICIELMAEVTVVQVCWLWLCVVAGVVMGHDEWGAEHQPASARHDPSGHRQPHRV